MRVAARFRGDTLPVNRCRDPSRAAPRRATGSVLLANSISRCISLSKRYDFSYYPAKCSPNPSHTISNAALCSRPGDTANFPVAPRVAAMSRLVDKSNPPLLFFLHLFPDYSPLPFPPASPSLSSLSVAFQTLSPSRGLTPSRVPSLFPLFRFGNIYAIVRPRLLPAAAAPRR